MEAHFSANTGIYYDIPLPDAVRRIAKLGFKYVELYRHSWEIEDVTKELKGIFKRTGIKPAAWHDHCEIIFWAAENPADIYCVVKQVKRRLDICARLNVPYLTLHYDMPDYRPGIFPGEHAVFKAFPEILEYAKQRGITILFENTGVRSEFIFRLCRILDSPNIGVCLDIGHANLFENISDAVKNGAELIKILHMSDNFGMREDGGFSDLHLAPGEGKIDWKKCMRALESIDYKGVLNFELNGSRYAREGVADIMGWGNYLPLTARDKLLRMAKREIRKALR